MKGSNWRGQTGGVGGGGGGGGGGGVGGEGWGGGGRRDTEANLLYLEWSERHKM